MSESPLCIFGHGQESNGEPKVREAKVGLLCYHHHARMTTTTTNIRELWYDLTFIIEAGTAPKDDAPKTKHLKSAEAPSPANLEALSLRDLRSSPVTIAANPKIPLHEGDQSAPIPPMLFVVASWLLLLTEERPLTGSTLPSSAVAQLEVLEKHHDWIAAQDWVEQYVEEMEDLKKALSLAVRDQPYRQRGMCRLPSERDTETLCGGALLEENGTGVVRCVRCKAEWSTPQEQARLAITLETI